MKLQQPPKGELWCHIDRLDRKDGRCWAVQWWDGAEPRYEAVRAVVGFPGGYSQYFGPNAKQPKAVIVVPNGRPEIRQGIAYLLTDEPQPVHSGGHERKKAGM